MESIEACPTLASSSELETLKTFITEHPGLAVLSGAGVSVESGIPDYRDALGNWKRPPPMDHQRFMRSHAARQRYWARALIGFRAVHHARPCGAHRALAQLEARGYVKALITQNVDGLHQQAGSRRVIDLHGRAELVRCMSCEAKRMRYDLHAELEATNPEWLSLDAPVGPDGDADLESLDFSSFHVPSCRRCGSGILKPDVVFFGDSVPADRVTSSMRLIGEARGLLVVGSSLMVFSGYRFVREAARLGKPIACVNLGRTRADALYQIKVEQSVGQALETLSAALEAIPQPA